MKLLKIDSIMLRVKDITKSASFYEKTLGMKRVWKDAERGMAGFTFSDSDSEIVIHDNNDIPSPSFSFLVNDVTKFCKDYAKTGNRILVQPMEVRTGKYAVLSDPNGNAIPIIDLTKFGGKPIYD